jgi:hypothetical protein
VIIKDEWIKRVIESPEREYIQADGRVRRWAKINENDGRYLKVVLLGVFLGGSEGAGKSRRPEGIPGLGK